MTLVVDHHPDISAPADEMDGTFGHLIGGLRECTADVAVRRCQGYVRRLEALEAELLAIRLRTGASERDVEVAAGRGSSRTKTEARKRAKRAQVLTHNPDLARELDQGRLTPEHLDAIASVAEQSDGAAVRDGDLIDRVKQANPDQARGIARDWLTQQCDSSDVEAEHQRQRRLRSASRFTTERGTKAIFAEGDAPAIDAIWNALQARSRELYQRDGGRDTPLRRHPRTREQRFFDALHHLVTDQRNEGDANQPTRPTVIAVAPLDALGGDADAQAELIGTGAIPSSVLERLQCNANLVGAIFSVQGQPLWLGRRVRMVTLSQWRALVARDRGCVLCGADPMGCEAHHIIPFEAPAKGTTDIDNLVLLCADCHHHTHDTHQTVERHADTGAWHLRPATPDEIPPPRNKPPP